MKVSRAKDAKPVPRGGDLFMGDVRGHNHSEGAKTLNINLVVFAPGGRTKWHRHNFEQGLVIMEGKGIVANEEGENVVEPGDVVIVPMYERHWHGGSETTGMAHLSINMGGGKSITLEPSEVKTKVT
jgi:quercetin dioxygenase-like cupin family protein